VLSVRGGGENTKGCSVAYTGELPMPAIAGKTSNANKQCAGCGFAYCQGFKALKSSILFRKNSKLYA
jgi:hypothetical protein